MPLRTLALSRQRQEFKTDLVYTGESQESQSDLQRPCLKVNLRNQRKDWVERAYLCHANEFVEYLGALCGPRAAQHHDLHPAGHTVAQTHRPFQSGTTPH